jgi:hypothetical protein|tara:strand:- start:955 stop:1209 length:255 start_codon:yes stop_codon:yes gene_type:complete
MTPENVTYYENYFDLFNSDGWEQLVEQAQGDKDNFQIEAIEDEKTLFKTQGQLFVLNTLINMEDMVRATYDSILIGEQEAANGS